MNYHGMTNKGDHKEYNEDYIDGFEHEGVLFLLVADGQGSSKGGQSAAHVAAFEIRKYIEEVFRRGMENQLEIVLRRAFYVAHRVIEGVRKGDPGRYYGLCTSMTVVALQRNKRITFAHVGNTKFFVFRDGQLIQMTQDHTVAQRLLMEQKISRDEIYQHPERAILTRGLGIFERVDPDITSGSVTTGDILLLVSDGITEHLSQHEISQLVLQAGNIEKTCEYLIQGSNERGGYDNLSVIASYINF